MEGPDIHGSMRIEKLPGGRSSWKLDGEETSLSFAEKVRRKVVSPLRCFTVKDMTYVETTRLQSVFEGPLPQRQELTQRP